LLCWALCTDPCRASPSCPSGLLGLARGPARLRSAPRARCTVAGGPRPGARPAPRRYAPRACGPGSGPLSAGARWRRRDLCPCARATTRRSASRPEGPGPSRALSFSDQPSLRLPTVLRARGPAGPAAPAAAGSLQRSLGDCRTGGGRVPPSRAFAMPDCRHGERRGDVPSSLAYPLGDPIDLRASGAPRRRRGSSPRLAARASPPRSWSVDWDGFSANPTRHLHCAARAWSSWARRAGSPQPPLWGREGDVSHPPGAASGRPVAAGGGLRGDVSLPLAFLLCDGGAVLQAHSYHPCWDKQEQLNEALLRRTHCVPA
jgi:hypothetical protein